MRTFRIRDNLVQAQLVVEEDFLHNDRRVPGVIYDPQTRCVIIRHHGGSIIGSIGDWIVIGSDGQPFISKSNSFAKNYESCEPGSMIS